MKSTLELYNTCKITLSKEGDILKEVIQENITCDIGRSSLLKRIMDDTTAGLGKAKYIAIGIGTQTPSIALLQLTNETVRSAIDETRTVLVGNQIKIYASFSTSLNLTISEAGVFLDNTATLSPNTGSLLCYSTGWTPIVKPLGQLLTIEWTINLGNSII